MINSAGTGYTDLGILFAAGGGTSLLWNEPAYQRGVVPPSMAKPPVGDQPSARGPRHQRSGRPVHRNRRGDHGTGHQRRSGTYRTFLDGGTSLAAPLVAGMVAAAQQGQHAAFGFVNPMLYSLAGTRALRDVLPVTTTTPVQDKAVYCEPQDCGAASVWTFDAQTEGETNQVTATGYDTMTGLGTPDAQAFIAALPTNVNTFVDSEVCSPVGGEHGEHRYGAGEGERTLESVEKQVPVSAVLASLVHSEHQVQEQPGADDVAEAAQAWELTPTEAFLEGKAAGLAQAQQEIRKKAGWPVEKEARSQ